MLLTRLPSTDHLILTGVSRNATFDFSAQYKKDPTGKLISFAIRNFVLQVSACGISLSLSTCVWCSSYREDLLLGYMSIGIILASHSAGWRY